MQIHLYLEDYADHFVLKPHIQFNTIVTSVERLPTEDATRPSWIVTAKNTVTNEVQQQTYDSIFICVGHYVIPDIPDIPGIKDFPGTILHSHDYRIPDALHNKKIMIVGSGPTAFDMVKELCPVASEVTLCTGKTDRSRYNLLEQYDRGIFPENANIKEWMMLIEDDIVTFGNGETAKADIIFLCSGYKYYYPFLDESCGVTITNNGKRVQPLFKHMFNIKYHTMFFLGTMNNSMDFTLPYLQVPLALKVLNKTFQLPSLDKMNEDAEREYQERLQAGLRPAHAHSFYHEKWSPITYATDIVKFGELHDVLGQKKYEAVRLLKQNQRNNIFNFREASYPYYNYRNIPQ